MYYFPLVAIAALSIMSTVSPAADPPPRLSPPPANTRIPPKRIRETRAFIPEEVLRRVSGLVELRLQIGKDGTVRKVEVLRGPKEIADPLAAAAMDWLYEPTLVKGRPVEVTTTTMIHIMTPPL